MEKCIPVVAIRTLSEVDSIMNALRAYNIHTAEITFRTDCATTAISHAVAHHPDMTIGAGTVINAEQCRAALDAGATFIVSPGLSASVAEVCRKANVPYYPGCVTPTEIMQALELGLNIIKFFPAHIYGGLPAIHALSAPFPQIRFIPTGGVNKSNMDDYLSCDKVVAVGGSFFVAQALKHYEGGE